MNFQEFFTERINPRDPTAKKQSKHVSKWKDPLNRHMMKPTRSVKRKDQSWVPKSTQKEVAITYGQKKLDIAKAADQGLWLLTYPESVAIASKYKMHLPTRLKPAKRLGSTGIVMWLKLRPDEEAKMFLVKHSKLLKGVIKKSKKKKRKPSDSSKYKAQKPQRAKSSTFKSHHVSDRSPYM